MKKKVQEYIRSLDGEGHYSGKEKVMYIDDNMKGQDKQSIEECVYIKFGFDLPFTLKTN